LFVQDNAGPHVDAVYKTWLLEQFNQRGWKLEHQAPQGPYTNVLDLQMFPAMSKRHSEMLTLYSNTESNNDRIWKVALQIWEECTSSMIARAFVHAYRIMKVIIDNGGSNHWLAEGTPHCNLRRDFVNTKYGIKPRING
jgi:alpha-D-ribose 1-methylphosphonate 5-phosphate C-P lyase